VILPALSAPGVKPKMIKNQTGFQASFGPVYARDIPDFLALGKKKAPAMRHFRFDLKHRADKIISMNFLVWGLLAVPFLVFWPHYFAGATVLFWIAVTWLYLLSPLIPGRTGWAQALFSAGVIVTGWGLYDGFVSGDLFAHWGWFVATFALFFAAGFDAAGIVSGRKSDAEQFLHKLGIKRLGHAFSEKDLGDLTLDRDRCIGCMTCSQICPIGVFGELDAQKKITIKNQDSCFACSACVNQCPESALSLGGRHTGNP